MRWQDFRRSDNIDDRTDGAPEGSAGSGGFGGGFPGGGGIRIGGGALVVIVIASLIFGVNPLEMLGLIGGGSGPVSQAPQAPPGYGPQGQPGYGQAPPGYGPQHPPAPGQTPEAGRRQDASHDFVAAILGDTEDVWGAVFKTQGLEYQRPKLVLFRGSTESRCGGASGMASAATGPFYCSADREVYLDTSFFSELARRFGAPGEFAQAYVIAHEVGHHVQNLTGTMRKVDQAMQRDPRGRNALSVRLELQADCYAGVWGYFAQKRGKLEPGDLESGFKAAQAVGDDQIQKRTQGYVVPESFTHGTAEQRLHWFKTGLESGDMRKCDTFAAQG